MNAHQVIFSLASVPTIGEDISRKLSLDAREVYERTTRRQVLERQILRKIRRQRGAHSVPAIIINVAENSASFPEVNSNVEAHLAKFL
jgi:hypothetical protein